ncbi:MAG: hypothetical protein LBN27_00090 [Prevotellaceae bacterium]|jgi:hypothetical protein|nr:hypothetical protein [Prevotellaceae bacterium]
MTTAKKNRLYKLHYQLRKRGNTVVARQRFVTKRAEAVSKQEEKWLRELVVAGYGVCDKIFQSEL